MMQRYKRVGGPALVPSIIGENAGDYVLFTDHEAALAERGKRIGELEGELEQWRLSRDGVMAENERLAFEWQQAQAHDCNNQLISERFSLKKEVRELTAERDAAIKEVGDIARKLGLTEAERDRLKNIIETLEVGQ